MDTLFLRRQSIEEHRGYLSLPPSIDSIISTVGSSTPSSGLQSTPSSFSPRFQGLSMLWTYDENPQFRRSPAPVHVDKMFELIKQKLPGPPSLLLCILPEIKNLDIYMGGINSLLSMEFSKCMRVVSRVPTIIIGMVVPHGSPGRADVSSIVVVVGSRHWPLVFRYRASVVEVSSSGMASTRKINRRHLLKSSGLRPRDIRSVDSALWLTNTMPSLLECIANSRA
ncbi:hypothetical protein L6452_37508 [Arctium lappa]|uniref:Uncharacterized protein n=1 Tax=Arctium lappa TaxID=4217 RepID=A0ACB8Y4P6_ARCLA|nr:hypothetical protein L6452_37508 [Arctium lappa]